MKLIRKIKSIYVFLFLLLIYFISNLYLLTFNPDPHHDGILLSAGYMTSQGMIPHVDYTFIWGPLLPLILSIPIKFISSLLILRFFGYICIILYTILLYKLISKVTSKSNSILISLTWLISYPPFAIQDGGTWPKASTAWPNMYAFIFVLTSVLILIRALTETNKKIIAIFMISAGLFAAFPLFIRISFLSIYLGIVIFILFTKQLRSYLYFFMTPLFLTGILLINQNKFTQAWVEQTFTVLKTSSVSNGVPEFTLVGISRAVIAILALFILYCASYYLFRNLLAKKFSLIKNILLFLLTTLYIYFVNNYDLVTQTNFKKLFRVFNKANFEFGLGYLSIALVMLIPITIANLIKNRFSLQKNPVLIFSGLLSFASLPLSHNINIDYIWLNSPFILLYVFISLNEYFKVEIKNLVLPSLLFCTILYSFNFISLISNDNYSYTNSPLTGMRDTNLKKGIDLDKEFDLIKKIPSGANLLNLCYDTLYVVSDRKNLVRSRALSANINPIYASELKPIAGDWIFLCNIPETQVNTIISPQKYYNLKSNGLYSVIYKFAIK